MLNIGHRGAMGHAPENTLASIQKALDFNVDWIEIDVYVVEGELVVIHDDTLDRTTNGTGNVMDQSLAALRELDAGDGEKIPLFSEVLALVDKRAGINVELKGPGTAAPAVAALEAAIANGWQRDQFLLSAFDHTQLLEAKALNPQLRRAGLYDTADGPNWDFLTTELAAYAVNPWHADVTPDLVDAAHAHGLKVFVYTVNDMVDISWMRTCNVDGIFTNYPDRV